jgi:hypothetical protein
MNPEIQSRLDHKIERIVYYAQSKDRVQVIRVIPKTGRAIDSMDRQTIIENLKSQLSPKTEVTDSSTTHDDFMIYIEVPEGEDLKPLHAVRQIFQKTP